MPQIAIRQTMSATRGFAGSIASSAMPDAEQHEADAAEDAARIAIGQPAARSAP